MDFSSEGMENGVGVGEGKYVERRDEKKISFFRLNRFEPVRSPVQFNL